MRGRWRILTWLLVARVVIISSNSSLSLPTYENPCAFTLVATEERWIGLIGLTSENPVISAVGSKHGLLEPPGPISAITASIKTCAVTTSSFATIFLIRSRSGRVAKINSELLRPSATIFTWPIPSIQGAASSLTLLLADNASVTLWLIASAMSEASEYFTLLTS